MLTLEIIQGHEPSPIPNRLDHPLSHFALIEGLCSLSRDQLERPGELGAVVSVSQWEDVSVLEKRGEHRVVLHPTALKACTSRGHAFFTGKLAGSARVGVQRISSPVATHRLQVPPHFGPLTSELDARFEEDVPW